MLIQESLQYLQSVMAPLNLRPTMRKAEFDQEYVLRSAMDVFIAKGYSKTSMQDLKKATGLHPGSIYNSFTNKRGLLLAALEHYRTERLTEFEALFATSNSVISGLKKYLDHVIDECEREEIKDCLLQKALSELAQQDVEVESVICQMLNQWQTLLTEKFQQAQDSQEIPHHNDAEALAHFFMMSVYGMRTLSHTQPKKGALRQLGQSVFNYITQS